MQSVPCAALVLLVNIRALLVALDIALRCRSFACRGPRGRHYCVELDSTLESCPVLMTYMDNKQIGTPRVTDCTHTGESPTQYEATKSTYPSEPPASH